MLSSLFVTDRIKCFTGTKIFSILRAPLTCWLCNRMARTEQVCLALRISGQSRGAGPSPALGAPAGHSYCQLRDSLCPGLGRVQMTLQLLDGAGAGSRERAPSSGQGV